LEKECRKDWRQEKVLGNGGMFVEKCYYFYVMKVVSQGKLGSV